ncbi:MAG: penicillin-binding protein [Bacteroidales bacterium]
MEEARKQILIRVYILYFFLLIAGLAIIGKVLYLQVAKGEELSEKARKTTMAYQSVEAVRGSIHDENGMLLATSVPVFDVRMDVASPLIGDELFYKKVDSLARGLANLFKDRHYRSYRADLVSNRRGGNRYMLLKRNISYSDLKVVRELPVLRRGKYRGGLIEVSKSRRVKPFRKLASRTIGYSREGYRVGLEGAYDHVLEGDSGKQLMRRIANGVWIPVDQGNIVEPKNGYDIVTTLDVNIQDVAESALEKNLRFHDASHGCAVLMEVTTGEVKAIANLKKDTATGEYIEAYNYAIGESREPGSTFKIASLMVGLEDNKFDIDDSVDTYEGETEFFGQKMVDAHENGYGRISVKQALEVSSNVGVSKLIYQAYGSRPEKFVEGLKNMRLDKPLGLEIRGEKPPLIKSPGHATWSKVTLPWMSIGYEVQMTPLQILTFYNAIANGGRMMKPMFVKEFRSAGTVVENLSPEVLNPSIASKETIEKARQMLNGVVEEGTAKNLFNTVYNISGKTGTAQIALGSGGYAESGHSASFVGYFPVDKPKYSCIVIVNKPAKGLYYGSAVAAPVFKEIADKVYATRLSIHEDRVDSSDSFNVDILPGYKGDFNILKELSGLPITHNESPSEFVKYNTEKDGFTSIPIHIRSGFVPDVRGMGLRDAVYLLSREGLKVQVFGRGKVARQSVKPGTRAVEGRKIMIELKL